ncbi:hypothetical protein FRC10_004039, partial [Ceratobasidium sp. 414]
MALRGSVERSSGGAGYISPVLVSGETPAKPDPPRKLIVCIDGTSNQYSDKVIHIEKSDTQLTYYNSGIGTYAKASMRSLSYLKQVISNGIDQAIAWNLDRVIIGAYRWLSDHYRPGDQIFLFGFSRGAYQVRAIAGMIATVSHRIRHELRVANLAKFAFELYASYLGGPDDEADKSIWLDPSLKAQGSIKLSKQKIDIFRRTFSRPSVDIHFLGAWETVSSIGLRRGRLLPLTNTYKHIKHFRHALALDERRVKFLPEHVEYPSDGHVDESHVKEVWFAGTHSDIGGGNTHNIELNRGTESLVWMINEAEDAGLKVDSRNLGDGVKRTQVIPSLKGGWWILEVLPLARLAYGSGGKRTISRPHLGRGRKISENHKIHYSVLANYLQVGETNSYQPRAKYRDPGADEHKVDWGRIFKDVQATETPAAYGLNWEGDYKIVDALRIVREVDAKVAENTRPGDPETREWLNSVNRAVEDDALAKMIWEYGGIQFLLRVAKFEDENEKLVSEIVRAILGMSSGRYLGDNNSVLSIDAPVSPISPISPRDRQGHMVFPPPTQSKSTFSRRKSSTDISELIEDHELDLKTVQDVIPRLPDLLTCYKRRERDTLVESDISGVPGEPALSRMIQAFNQGRKEIWAKIRKVPGQGQSPQVPISPQAPARAGTKDSARSVSEAVNNLATLKLVQIAFDIIVELAKNGYSRDIAAADVIRHVVPFLTVKATFVDAPRDIRQLSQSKFYDEQTASKVIALMGDDKYVVFKALRSLAALAMDRKSRSYSSYSCHHHNFDALKQSLVDTHPELVTQAIQTITAVAEDGKYWSIDEYLVRKGIIPQILRVLSNSNQNTGRKSAIRAIRRLSNSDTARLQLFENDAISTLQPVIESSPDALCIIESLANHTEARERMIENEIFATVVSLIDSTAKHVSQRAMYVVAAFALHDDGRKEVVKKNVAQKLIPRLQEDFILSDALEVVITLASH